MQLKGLDDLLVNLIDVVPKHGTLVVRGIDRLVVASFPLKNPDAPGLAGKLRDARVALGQFITTSDAFRRREEQPQRPNPHDVDDLAEFGKSLREVCVLLDCLGKQSYSTRPGYSIFRHHADECQRASHLIASIVRTLRL